MSCGKALVFKVYDSLKDGRALDRPYGVRGSDLAAQCQAARKHRDPDAGVFLIRSEGAAHAVGSPALQKVTG